MKEQQPPDQAFSKTHDYIHDYRGYHQLDGTCRIRVYEKPGAVPVVIASELPDNTTTSVTNMAEHLAAEIIAKHFPQRFEEDQPVIWVEHYPPIEAYGKQGKTVEYSLVEFDSYTPKRTFVFGQPRVKIGDPSWRHLSEEDLETLLGQKLTRGADDARA